MCAETILAAPLGSENLKVNVRDVPLPELGVTDTAAGGLLPPVTLKDAEAV